MLSDAGLQTGRVLGLLFELLMLPLGGVDPLLNSAYWGVACALAHAAYCAFRNRSASDPSPSTG
jgi:hypothetical protein